MLGASGPLWPWNYLGQTFVALAAIAFGILAVLRNRRLRREEDARRGGPPPHPKDEP